MTAAIRRFCLAFVLFLVACSQDSKTAVGTAVAMRVSSPEQLIGGPKALGQVGDYLLENDKVRFIVHGPGVNRASSLFPGVLLDADIQRPGGAGGGGNDQLGELIPAFAFSSFQPGTFRIIADGSDGGDAVLRVEGAGRDLLQLLNVLNIALLSPSNLDFAVEYRLSPGATHLEIITSITNIGAADHGLPFLDPSELRNFGLDIPGLDELQLSTPLGQAVLFAKTQEQFAPGRTGFDLRFSLEDSYAEAPGLPAFPGRVIEYFGATGEGISYGIAVPSSPQNYPNAFRSFYESTQDVTDHSLLVPFSFSGLTGVYHTNPPLVLASGETFEYSTYFLVGAGGFSSVTDAFFALRNEATGTFSGRVLDQMTTAPVAGASLVVSDRDGNYVTQIESDARGAFVASLRPGAYQFRVVSEGRVTTAAVEFEIAANDTTTAQPILPSPSTLSIAVRDQDGRPLPAKVSVVGFLPADRVGQDPRRFLYDLSVGEKQRPVSLQYPDRFVEAVFYTRQGSASKVVRAGRYDVYVSRGVEYDVETVPVVLTSGAHEQIEVTLRRAFDSDGYLIGDMHLHSVNSIDSPVTLRDRVVQIAGEGVEYAVATDHNRITDYAPAIAAEGLTDWLVSSVGNEISSLEMGHFNAYPLEFDSASARGGDVRWVGETPTSIFDQARDKGRFGPDETIVQINHPRWSILGYFNAFNFDQDLGAPIPLTGLRAALAPVGPEFALDEFSLDFDALEVINGKRLDLVHSFRVPETLPPPPLPDNVPPAGEILRGAEGRVAFPGVVEDWFALLNQGLRKVAVGSSDSHGQEHPPGSPVTFIWVGTDKDDLGRYSERDAVRGIQTGRAIASNGPFVEAWVGDSPIGSLVEASDGQVRLRLEVTTANWQPVDRVVVWSNGKQVAAFSVPAGRQHHYQEEIDIPIERDAWFVVEATGRQTLFPVVTELEFEDLSPETVIAGLASSLDLSALAPFGNLVPTPTYPVTPFAITNPIWVDRDGNGRFDGNGASGNGARARRGVASVRRVDDRPSKLDVRHMFDSMEDHL